MRYLSCLHTDNLLICKANLMSPISLGTASRRGTATSDLDSNNIGRVIIPWLWPVYILCFPCCYHALCLLVICLSILWREATSDHVAGEVWMMTDVTARIGMMKMVNPMMSRQHLWRDIALPLSTASCVHPALSIGKLVELNACGSLMMEIINGLHLLNHFTFWCYYLILISLPIMEQSATVTNKTFIDFKSFIRSRKMGWAGRITSRIRQCDTEREIPCGCRALKRP